jgi:hypothetical protein
VTRLFFVAVFAALASAQPVTYSYLREGVLEERLKRAHKSIPERYKRLRALFEETGCQAPALREQPVRGSKEPNLICDVAGLGASQTKIIVGAHFDAAGGDGVVDNWTGAILLPSLAEGIRNSSPRHRFEFVGFAAEEKGLLGSQAYLKAIPKPERAGIATVITIDSLGLSYTKFWPSSSSPPLVDAARRVANALQLQFSGVNVDQVGTTDSMIFFREKIPVLSLHSVTQQTWPLINGPFDVWSAISWRDYYDTHRLVSALLAYLDASLP